MAGKWGFSETVAEEVAIRVFERFYRYPTFTVSKCTIKDIAKCFRFYLYKIARNELANLAKPDESLYTGEEKVITTLINPHLDHKPERSKQLKEREKQLDEIFSKLTQKHKIIYLTYKYYEKEGRYLPKQLREELKDVVQLSQSSIRVYKKEAFELVKLALHGK